MILDEEFQKKKTLVALMKLISKIYPAINESEAHNVRFLNTREPEREEGQNWDDYLEGHEFGGLTRVGTQLQRQILDNPEINKTSLGRPLRVLIFTDGAVYLSPEISKTI